MQQLFTIITTLLLFWSASSHAQQRIDFSISSQPLPGALTEYADQSDLQILFQSSELPDIRIPALQGKYTAEEAITRLLDNTDLEYVFGGNDTVVIRKKKTASSDGKENERHLKEQKSEVVIPAQNDANKGTTFSKYPTTGKTNTKPPSSKQVGFSVIEEITVTAQKREQRLQDVPLTVSAFDASFLTITGVNGVQELQQYVPALNISSNTNAFTAGIRLRGIGTAGNETSFEPGVGFFIDGVYQSRSGLGMADLTDIERVEILYGPQSTLYGKSTNAGIINVITKAPTSEFEGNLEFSTGNFGLLDGRFSISGPVSDSVAYRLSGRAHVRDGFMSDLDPAGGGGKNSLDDINDLVLRGQLLFTPNDRFDIRLIWDYTNRDQACCSGELDAGPVHVGIAGAFGIPQAPLNATDRIVSLDFPVTFTQDSTAVTATINYYHDAFTLTSITAYNHYDWEGKQDTDFSSIDWWQVDSKRNEGETWSQEIRIASNTDGRFDWLGGVYYDTFNLKKEGPGLTPLTMGVIPGFVLPATLPPPLTAAAGDTAEVNYEWDQQYIAVFGQVGYDLTDKLTVSAGLRFKYEKKDARFIQNPITASPFSIMALVIVPAMDEDLSRKEDSVTWTASARYLWSDDIMTFLRVATGEKSGGFTAAPGLGITSSQREYDAEKTISYELGIKSQWLSNRLQLNASLFYTEIEDFQNQTFDATSGAFIIGNAPLQTSRGVDIEASAIVTDWFTLNTALEVLDAKYDNFPNGPCFLGHPDSMPFGGNCDVSGENLPWAPKWSAVVTGSFVWPVGANQLYARIDYSYTGDHVAADDLDPLALQSYDVLNLRTGIRGQMGKNSWDVSLWIKNITDEIYLLQRVGVPLFPGSYMQWLNPPRTWGVTLSFIF